jgi:hypothetical protein
MQKTSGDGLAARTAGATPSTRRPGLGATMVEIQVKAVAPEGCEMEQLLTLLDEAFEKKSWHGTNLRGSIRGMSAARAAWRPAPARHNIWEIVVHAAYWKYAVRRKLTGAKRGSFTLPGANWFERSGAPDSAAWKKDVALLVAEHKALRQAVTELPPAARRDPAMLRLIRGVAAHDLYHAGQIQLLKRLAPVR